MNNIYFRGIDLGAIVEKYRKGDYSNVKTSLFTKNISIKVSNSVVKQNDDTIKNKSFLGKISEGIEYICLGNIIYDSEGHYKPATLDRAYNCMYCIKPIAKTENMCGLPIKRTYDETQKCIIFHMIDVFCCWDCAYAEYAERHHNSLYDNTLVYMKEIFTLSTGKPCTELRKATDRRCLQIFNGPLSYEDFHQKTIRFTKKPINVYFFPTAYSITQDSNKK